MTGTTDDSKKSRWGKYQIVPTGDSGGTSNFAITDGPSSPDATQEETDGLIKDVLALLNSARELGFKVVEWSVAEEERHIMLLLRRLR